MVIYLWSSDYVTRNNRFNLPSIMITLELFFGASLTKKFCSKYANLYGEGKLKHNRQLNGGKLFMDTQIVKCLSVKCGTQFTGLCNLCEKTGEEFD